jgi:hypothetical protein
VAGRLLIAVLAAVVVGGAAVVFLVLRPGEAGARPGQPDQGSASSLGRLAGFDVTVSDVHVPDAAGRVTLAVSFRNTSSVQQRADPQDFTFRDASGATAQPVFDAACPRWTRADLHPAGGASQTPRDSDARQVGTSFGPVPLCFAVAHPATSGPTLVWDPDIGPLGTPVAIRLR